ncbi:PREDICTED: MMS19 nucleotide excision repair protein homolog [Nanorana parkeri]|uniref:MMS19 nucleotide excision repair protein homolog n=1 Tax=Nanorana parkeri TaxID=125878 RepID=UPI000854AF32|nr:PREDICTED: MMS19 nucleotide excision repair protein homolog [Nanorana parkeri]
MRSVRLAAVPQYTRAVMAEAQSALWGLVEEFVTGQQDSAATEVATGVKDGAFTVLQVVESLGSCLANPEPRSRGRGVQLLSQVLLQCYSRLTEKEVEVLVVFYENRLKDHHVITPHVLQGLKALSMSEVFPLGLAVSVLKSIFQEVHVQSLMQLDRHTVYLIITNFMKSREEELKSLGADFTFGFIQVMDGEKDPRNLLVAFRIVHDIITKNYALGPFVEELFEVVSCYFPIDFNPPSNDPHGITREDLILGLRAVLAATPRFAEFLLPLLIEKMDSDIQSAKLDSLETLKAACAVCGQKELNEFLPGLWSSIRREVFQTASEKVETEGLAALQALTACLSRSVLGPDSEDSLDGFLNNILQDCRHHLCEPDMKLVWPSAKLLQAAAGASSRACLKVSASVLPLLLEQYNQHAQSSHRRTILEMTLGFLKLQSKWLFEEDGNGLQSFREALCSMVFSAVTDPSAQLHLVAVKAMTVLSTHQGFLSAGDIDLVVEHLTRLILEETDPQSCQTAIEASGSLATIHPSVFISRMVPQLCSRLQIVSMEGAELAGSAFPEHSVWLRCLEALAAMSTHHSIVEETVPILLSHLRGGQKGETNAEDVVAVCESLHRVAVQCQQNAKSLCFYHKTVVPCLLSLTVQAAMQDRETAVESNVLLNDSVLTAMVPVISAATSHLDPELASSSVSQIVNLFLDGDVSVLTENNFTSKFHPFQTDGPTAIQSRLVALLMAFVCSLPRNVEIPHLSRLLQHLLSLSLSGSSPFAYSSSAKCFAGLINKCPSGDLLDNILQSASCRIELGLADEHTRTQALTLLVWVTKALILRYHPLNGQLTKKMIGLLCDGGLGPLAADMFSLLVSECPDILNKACHADIRIMFRQRFFTENVPKLVEGFNSANEGNKPNYLKALSHVLNCLPKQVLLTELPSLFSLLLEALSCSDRVVQLSTLTCLEPLLLDAADILKIHIDTLIKKLLHLTCSPSMAVRISALKCMLALTKLPLPMLLPYKQQVLRALAKPLDDKKRLVRKEAVEARCQWFLIGCPGS